MANVFAKQDICDIGRRIYTGFAAANDGNISVRVQMSSVYSNDALEGFLTPMIFVLSI